MPLRLLILSALLLTAALSSAPAEVPMHCALLQSEELQVIVGDCSRNGSGGPQYTGLWSLTHKTRVFNAFGNSYAGLLPGELRGRAGVVLEPGDDRTATLHKPATDQDPTAARATYRLVGPNSLEHTLMIKDGRSRLSSLGYREVSWCSYMNSPDDVTLHFLSGGKMVSYISPEHGVGSRIGPAFVEALEPVPPQDEKRSPFHVNWAPLKFDAPFYYGRLGHMMLLYVFDKPDDLRFFCSPSGGGSSLIPGQSCPAWDFLWIVPQAKYAVDKELWFRVWMVYKPYVSDEDVLAEVKKAQDAMAANPLP